MGKIAKTLDKILRASADANIRFADLCALLHYLGFAERTRGDHHIFTREGVVEILNLQPRGDKAKAYQVKQVRSVLTSYGLAEKPPTDKQVTERQPKRGKGSSEPEKDHGE